jgi:hypothetical protein
VRGEWSIRTDLLARRDLDRWLEWAIGRLDDWGLVLDSDPVLPSLASLVVERPIRGSWWADPEAHLIYRARSSFVSHEDVLHVVLVSGKLTCIHRRLWPAFLAVALGVDDWKLDGLTPIEQAMWTRLRLDKRVTADEPGLPSTSARANGAAMRELESRLLCAGGNVHTARGSHAKYVTTWDAWRAEMRLPDPRLSAEEGRRQLDECMDRLNREFRGRGTLPWWRVMRSRRG